MSYEPTIWKTGDIVSSEKLNKLENGVAGAGGGDSGPCLVDLHDGAIYRVDNLVSDASQESPEYYGEDAAGLTSATQAEMFDALIAAVEAGRPLLYGNVKSQSVSAFHSGIDNPMGQGYQLRINRFINPGTMMAYEVYKPHNSDTVTVTDIGTYSMTKDD